MSLRAFLGRIAAWLPPCFAGWYWAAPFHAAAAGGLAQAILGILEPDVIEGVERAGHQLTFVTTLAAPLIDGRRGVLTPEVDALLYTFGVPLFVALMLASRAGLARLALGACILLPIQAAGIVAGFLVQMIGQGTNVASVTGIAGWRAEAVVLAYQFASLVMPAAAPILAWCALRRDFIVALEWRGASPPQPA